MFKAFAAENAEMWNELPENTGRIWSWIAVLQETKMRTVGLDKTWRGTFNTEGKDGARDREKR